MKLVIRLTNDSNIHLIIMKMLGAGIMPEYCTDQKEFLRIIF